MSLEWTPDSYYEGALNTHLYHMVNDRFGRPVGHRCYLIGVSAIKSEWQRQKFTQDGIVYAAQFQITRKGIGYGAGQSLTALKAKTLEEAKAECEDKLLKHSKAQIKKWGR